MSQIQFLFIVLSFLWNSCGDTATVTTSIDKNRKSLNYYEIKGENGEKVLKTTVMFNENGQKVKAINFNNEDTNEEYWEYDTDGNMVKYFTKNENGEDNYEVINVYKNGNLVKETTTFLQGLDENDDSPNSFDITFAYNDKGDKIKTIEYLPDGTIDKIVSITYNYQSDRLISSATYEQDGENGEPTQTQQQTFEYNDAGKVLKETSQLRFGTYTYTYTYHKNGNQSGKISMMDDTEKVVEQNDKNGNRIVEEVFRRTSANEEFILDFKNEWEYDEYGNEIAHRAYRNGQLFKQDTREITYWE